MLCLVALLLLVSSSTAVLYPHTLLNTEVKCKTTGDCETHHNHSWCVKGVLCIHHYCKLVPDHPCRLATQQCIESEKRCVDKKCTRDEECNNAIYCDGEEICSKDGVCITDPSRPSCHYTGGQCDEIAQTCHQPKVRLAWRSEQGATTEKIKSQSSTTGGVNQVSASITSLIIVVALTGLVFLVVMFYLMFKAFRNQ